MNKMMNALILENFGDHEFTRVELPIPQPEAGQVLVRIHASGVNPIDYKIRLGEAPYAMPELPAVLGTDMAGVVTAVGEGVTHFNVGEALLHKGLKGRATLSEPNLSGNLGMRAT